MGWAFTQPILFTFGSELFLGNLANKVTDQAGELHREDVLGGWTGSHALEGFEVLQGHGLLINILGGSIDGLQEPSGNLQRAGAGRISHLQHAEWQPVSRLRL